MKDKKEKEKKGAKTSETIVEEEKAADSVETEAEEKELDRESMSDEEYIAALEERVGKCVAEAQKLRAGDAIEVHMRGGNVAAEVTDGELHL